MASWHTEQIKWATGLGALMSFYGVVGMIVWLIPNDKLGGSAMTYKIVVISLVLLTLPFALVGGYFVSRRNKKKKEEAEKNADAKTGESSATAPAKLAKPEANGDITQAAEETVQFLKSSNLNSGKDAVYALPWYIVAGAPKSGKSSLSLASGLNFQTLPSQRQSEQKFIRPTRSIDWRVTSDAVLVDTAGRYQTETDQEEWSSLLETIKKYRGVRPIDGMILTVNAERLLQSDEKELEEMAKVMRARVDEAIQRTKVRFPIYLVFTHADSIEGFRDSFSTSRKEDKNLVWGATIPLEQSQNAHTLFDPEYDLLHNSVMKRRLMRLSAPFPPIRQIKIFNFPLHFGSARKKLGNFVSVLFRPNPFSESPFLRGFYFTAVPVNRPQMKGGGGQTMTNVAQTVGQTYFTEKLFRDVILRDKDLVATFQAQKVSPPILGWLLTLLGTFLTVALLAGAGYSLYLNKQVVDKATDNATTVMSMYRGGKNVSPLAKSPADTQIELEKIEELRKSMLEFDDYDRNGAPLVMRFGLYSGNRIFHERLLPVYLNAVEQRFKRPVIAKIEEDLQKFAATPSSDEKVLEDNYNLLQAYLMLSKKEDIYRNNIDAETINSTLKPYWIKYSNTPANSEALAENQLKFFSSQVSRSEYLGFEPNSPLVANVRKNLKQFNAVIRTYKRIIREVSQKVKPIDVNTIVGARSQGVFNGGNVTVQGAYTIEGYQSFMKDAIDRAKDELNKPDWVVGENVADKQQTDGQDTQRLQEKYFNDYVDKWKNLIADVQIAEFKKPDEAAKAMKAFSDDDSPMGIFLREVARQTNLSAKPKETGLWSYLPDFLKGKKDIVIGGDTKVETQFAPLFKFVAPDEKGKSGPLSSYNANYTDLSKDLEDKTADDIKEISKNFALKTSGNTTVSLVRTAVGNINNSAKPFESSDSAASKEIAVLIKKPINNLTKYLGASGVEEIGKSWTEKLYKSAQNVEKGYPFDNNGEADMTKIIGFYNPVDGELSTFYKDNLAAYFDESTPRQVKLKEANKDMFSPEFVNYLNYAFRLQNTLFPNKSKTPKYTYNFALQKINNETLAVEGTIDGQPVNSTGTGSADINFPSSGGDAGVILNFTSSDSGSTSTTSSANSGSTTVTPSSSPVSKYQQSPSGSGIAPIREPGQWGIFKFFEKGSPKKDPATGVYTLTYTLSNKKSLTIVITPKGGDLFDRSYFTLVKAPEKLK